MQLCSNNSASANSVGKSSNGQQKEKIRDSSLNAPMGVKLTEGRDSFKSLQMRGNATADSEFVVSSSAFSFVFSPHD